VLIHQQKAQKWEKEEEELDVDKAPDRSATLRRTTMQR
jgi:hypothetical protein